MIWSSTSGGLRVRRDKLRGGPGDSGAGDFAHAACRSRVADPQLCALGECAAGFNVPPRDAPELQVDKRSATPDYFRTMEIPPIAGRFFTQADTDKSQPVVLIGQKMAERFWPKGGAVGKRIRQGDKEPWLTIVGVVGVVKQCGLDI